MVEPMFKIKEEKKEENFSEFHIEPLEPGYGHTLGTALRRVMLTSIPGVAVTSVKIADVKHKFSTIPGLKENVVDLLLNIKGLHLKMADGKTTATVKLSARGPKEITAKDLTVSDGVEVVNPDHYLGYLNDKKAKLDIEFTVEKGMGYSLAEERKVNTLGTITTDAIFTPVQRVNAVVEATRVGRQTNLDKLILSVWTNGVVSPKEALDQAGKILASYFFQVYEPKAAGAVGGAISAEATHVRSAVSEDLLKLTIDELDLPTRIYNSLRNGGIETLGQLLETPRKELISMRNMGGKSIAIVEDKLKDKGISFSS